MPAQDKALPGAAKGGVDEPQETRLKALQEVSKHTDFLEKGLLSGQANLQAELAAVQKEQHRSDIGAAELRSEMFGRMDRLQSGYKQHADEIQSRVDGMKAELSTFTADAEQLVSGMEATAAAAISTAEATHARMLHERWSAMESEMAAQRKAFDEKMDLIREAVEKREQRKEDRSSIDPASARRGPVNEQAVDELISGIGSSVTGWSNPADDGREGREPWEGTRGVSASGLVGATVVAPPEAPSRDSSSGPIGGKR